MKESIQNEHLWSIILADGEEEGRRLFVQRWLGSNKPKQYCTFIGTRSMFQHTVDRADRLSSSKQRVTVIAKAHHQEALKQLAGREEGELVVQPESRDTAPGIFLPVTHVMVRDPQATVVIYPSDHFVYPENQFARAVEAAVRAANLLTNNLILIAVHLDRIEPEYGWMQPRLRLGCIEQHSLHRIETFVGKPNEEFARKITLSRALCSTLILVARVKTVWMLGWLFLPKLMELFEEYRAFISTSSQQLVREAVYQRMPRRNFSSQLLARVPSHIVAFEMTGVLWSDWGSPERIASTLRQIGKEPNFCTHRAGIAT